MRFEEKDGALLAYHQGGNASDRELGRGFPAGARTGR